MELDTEFRYPNVIDFWGTTLYHLCQFTLLDLNKYAAYNNYAENNIEENNKRLCEEIEQRIKESDKKYHEDIIDDYHQRCRSLETFIPLCIERQWLSLYIIFSNTKLKLCAQK